MLEYTAFTAFTTFEKNLNFNLAVCLCYLLQAIAAAGKCDRGK